MTASHQQVLDFFMEMEKLKTVQRFNRTLDQRFENSAEHSWQVAMAAQLLKDYFPHAVDMSHVISMLLIHDMCEIYAGDTWLFDTQARETAFAKELASITQTFSVLPPKESQDLLAIWQEFETGQTAEARYAKVIDALVPLISHYLVSPANSNPDHLTKEMVLAKKAFIEKESAELWQLTCLIIDKSVSKGLYKE